MALPSQRLISPAGRGARSRGKTSIWVWVLAGVVIVLAIWLAFILWGRWHKTSVTPTAPTSANIPVNAAASNGATSNTGQVPPPSHAPPPASNNSLTIGGPKPPRTSFQTSQTSTQGTSTSSTPGTSANATPVANNTVTPTPPAPSDPSTGATSATSATSANNSSPATSNNAPPTTTPPALASRLNEGMKLIEQGKFIPGREELSTLFFNHGTDLSPRDAQAIRDTLTSVNQQLVFGPKVNPNDPTEATYTVKSGDLLGSIARRNKVPYQFLEMINKIDARRLRVGQNIKVIHGPFSAVVDKSDFRLDLYLSTPDNRPIYVRSFPIGLGKDNSTPVGQWEVAPGGKVTQPTWTNPRTGKFYSAKDPENPLGGFWMRLEGTGTKTKGLQGYGIHGTIHPESIGHQASMGCIRMAHDDIVMMYSLLVGGSKVEVRP